MTNDDIQLIIRIIKDRIGGIQNLTSWKYGKPSYRKKQRDRVATMERIISELQSNQPLLYKGKPFETDAWGNIK